MVNIKMITTEKSLNHATTSWAERFLSCGTMPNDQSRHLSPASLLIDNDHTYGPKKSNVSLEGVIGNLPSAKHPCPPSWGRVKVAPPNDNTSQKSQKMASNQKTGCSNRQSKMWRHVTTWHAASLLCHNLLHAITIAIHQSATQQPLCLLPRQPMEFFSSKPPYNAPTLKWLAI